MSPIASAVLSRVGQAFVMAWLLATLCFVFTHALPGDMAFRIAVGRTSMELATADAVARVAAETRLNDPVLSQYLQWIRDLLQLNFGTSLITRQPVAAELWVHARATLLLAFTGWTLSYAVALPIGIWAGFWPGGIVDRSTVVVASMMTSLPTFLIGMAFISVFALNLQILPPSGSRTWAHLILPTLTLSIGLAGFSVRIIRNAIVDVRSAFYMTHAQIRGLRPGQAFRHHGVRNSAIPIITFAALQFAYVVDGFIIVETLFDYPGIGGLLITALLARDVPLIMGCGIFIGFTFSTVNLLADIAAMLLDPRRRLRIEVLA